ncbi:penicillin-binding protein [Vagococcus coleopterorum]|uniref:Penicillin-binding protein n=1 Tax=Vagococcus coleopterorum TaxID=2714946 RepID=A0A6G8ANS6_9ENTE|nr:transglycosylase domain-containing protein [Vagococcus coleopterorum]QIL46734.1 penicillin-binding protein [Vagococcus coleopterorum]
MSLFKKKKATDKITKSQKELKLSKESAVSGFNIFLGVMKSLAKAAIITIFLLGTLGLGVGMGYFANLVSDTKVPDKKTLQNKINDVEQISTLTYSNGDKIANIKSDLSRTSVTSEQISPLVKKALISTEDENFNEHNGVVPKAIFRALISDVLGSGGSGGSTITQQLVKQQVLTSETSYKRKANEILLALKTEKYFDKDEIITAYLNVSPFGRDNTGQNIAGVEEAATGIFGVHADNLTIPQAAFIAGLPQSPIVYSPYLNTGELKNEENLALGLKRKDNVLFNMYKEDFITKEEYDDALAYDLSADFKDQESASNDTNGFLYQYVQQEAVNLLMPTFYEKDGLTKDDIKKNDDLAQKYNDVALRELRRSGVTIETTIDKAVYDAMQEAEKNSAWKIDDGRGTIQNGSVIMDNQTGRVISFVGGRDYSENQNNHAFQTRRSPGSTIKPLIAYAPAIDVGLIGSDSMLSNNSRKYRDGDELRNYSGESSKGFKSAREALKVSDNVPVVELYQELLNHADPEAYFKKMNMVMDSKEFKYESIPVGGTDYGPTVFEQTNAFATLANKGQYSQGYAIEKITKNDGTVLYQHEVKPVQVYSPATASIMNNMMRDVVNYGTGFDAKNSLANLGSGAVGGDWVGKTGTSQEFKDYWFIASTPTITISSWMGYDDNTSLYADWDIRNKQLWADLTNAAYQANPDLFGVGQQFTLDPSVIQTTVSSFTGQLPDGTVDVQGKQRSIPGKSTLSLWAQNGPGNSTFRFGIGGTDGEYLDAWNDAAKKPAKKDDKKKDTADKDKDSDKEKNDKKKD